MKLSTIERKKYRVRNKLKKSSNIDRYRLSVSRSSRNISAQIIDDVKNITLISASSLLKELKSKVPYFSNQNLIQQLRFLLSAQVCSCIV